MTLSIALFADCKLLLASALFTCRDEVGATGVGFGSRTGAGDVGLTGAGVGLTGAGVHGAGVDGVCGATGAGVVFGMEQNPSPLAQDS
jgi:hypothetical protein